MSAQIYPCLVNVIINLACEVRRPVKDDRTKMTTLVWLVTAALCATPTVSSLSLRVANSSSTEFSAQLKPGDATAFDLNENHTLHVELATTFTAPPKVHVVALECGSYSVSFPFTFRQGKLSIAFTPLKLRKLYKHAEVYNLRLLVSDPQLKAPLFWDVAKVTYITDGEVVDNYEDVEWDFQPPVKTPSGFVVRVFTLIMFVPFAVLLVLLLANGCNCGYFPRSIEAVISLAFVAGLGAFFAFFIYFWRYVTFEEMFKYLLVIVPVLGILLRGALVGRAKMAVKVHSE